MNRQQRRAAKRETNRKTKLPAHIINKYRAKPSDYAEQQYLNARIAATLAADDPPDRAHREAVWQRNEAMINDAVYCRELDTVIPLLSQVVLETELALRFYDDLPEAAPRIWNKSAKHAPPSNKKSACGTAAPTNAAPCLPPCAT